MIKTYVAVQRTGQQKNELTHWKYIKRERGKNGKWKYYYDKDSLRTDINNTANKIKETGSKIEDNVKDKLGYDERDARDRAISENKKALDNLNKAKRTGEYDDALQQLRESNDKALKAIDKYSKTPIGRLDHMQASIKYGLSAAEEYLNLKKHLRIK